MPTNTVPAIVVTHDGIFHADDVFACAVLRAIHPDIRIIRTRRPDVLNENKANPDAILVDVGGELSPEQGVYDHHQRDGAGTRPLGTPYSSFGLVWRYFGGKCIASRCNAVGGFYGKEPIPLSTEQQDTVWDDVDNSLVSAVDVIDCNGMRVFANVVTPIFTVSQVIGGMNTGEETAFTDALSIASGILNRHIESTMVRVRKHDELLSVMAVHKGQDILTISDFFPGWGDIVKKSGFKRVIFQDVSGSWRVQVVPGEALMPAAWGGLNGAELDIVAGIKGGIFCHCGCYIAGHETYEGALDMARKSIVE